MTRDDKSTILEFLGWEHKYICGRLWWWSLGDWRHLDLIPLDENLIAQALAKFSEGQKSAYNERLIHLCNKWIDANVFSHCEDNIIYWCMFKLTLSTKAEVVAGVIRGREIYEKSIR